MRHFSHAWVQVSVGLLPLLSLSFAGTSLLTKVHIVCITVFMFAILVLLFC